MITRIRQLLIPRLSWKFQLGFLIWLAVLAAGLFGLWERLTTGHTLAGYGSYVPWGLWVVLYFYGAGLSAGVFVAGAGGHLAGAPGLRSASDLRRVLVLSTAVLLPALLGIALDLGQLLRGSYVMLFSSFGSVMTVNSWLYTIFIGVLLVSWLLSWRRSSGWLNPLLLLGVALSLAFAAGSGLFLGAVHVKPAWHNPLLPLFTLASALATGSALLLCFQSGADAEKLRLPRRFLVSAVLAYFLLTLCQAAVQNWYPGGAASTVAVGPVVPGWFPWVLGGVLPLVLLASRSVRAWRLAGLLVVLTFFWSRLQLVLSGQPPLEMPALTTAFQHESLVFSYQITAMELRVALLLLAVGVAIYVIGGWINLLVADAMARDPQ